MPKLIEMADRAKVILIGGTICTGKDTATEKVIEIMGHHNHRTALISLTECVRIVGGLRNDDPREKYCAVFKGKENDPWLAKAISNVYEIEDNAIAVISGLRRKCDAEYFHLGFSNSYFISLMADEATLVKRMVSRNRKMDFPPGTPESEKPAIARGILAEEEKVHGIMAMLGYVSTQAPRQNTYLIDTGKQEGTTHLELTVHNALRHFKLV